MKKVFMILVCLYLLSASAMAAELSDFEYLMEDGSYAINFDAYYYTAAKEKIAASGVALVANDYLHSSGVNQPFTFDNAAFEADYAAALKAMQEPVESEVVENETTDTTVSSQPTNDSASDDKYPLGSYIDEMGRVYSPTGQLLSSGTEAPSYLDTVGPILDDVLDISDEVETGNELSESRVYQVVDMRSADDSAELSAYSVQSSTVNWFTNQIPISIDTDGSVYNEVGYLEDYVFTSQSAGKIVSTLHDGYFVTGYIPLATYQSVIRLKGISVGDLFSYVCFYSDDFSYLSCSKLSSLFSDNDGDGIYEYTYIGEASYFRIGSKWSDPVVTVNEEIVYRYGEVPVLSGLKAIIISIFGEYTPVYTTGSVTETVGDVTTTTLYDVVAEGAAGIDFEWIAGVFLFGVLLFCLMKLLGGILK